MAATLEIVLGPSDEINEILSEDKLVEIWPDYPCLYDVRSNDFKNRDKREHALEAMASKVGRTVDWVKMKLRILRNSFTKLRKSASSGSARKNPTKRSVWLMEHLQFLAPYVASRASISNLESPIPSPTEDGEAACAIIQGDDIDDNEDETTSTPKSTKLPIKPRPKSWKRQREEEEFELLKGLSKSLSNRDANNFKAADDADEITMFGKYISESLRKLDPTARHMAQHNINNVIFQAQIGNVVPNPPIYQQTPVYPQTHQYQSHPTTTQCHTPHPSSTLSKSPVSPQQSQWMAQQTTYNPANILYQQFS